MQSVKIEPRVVWEIFAVSYERSDATEGASRKINEVRAQSDVPRKFEHFSRQQVIDLLDNGRASFVTAVPPKPAVTVVPQKPADPQMPYKDRYLRTDADSKLSDNLGQLPEYDAIHEKVVKEFKAKR